MPRIHWRIVFLPSLVASLYVLYTLGAHHSLHLAIFKPTFGFLLTNLGQEGIPVIPPETSSANEPAAEKVSAPSSLKTFTRHIVAVGDLHGDLPNARRVLQFAGVTDAFGNWSGNVDFFVQTGDIIDRGDDTIPLFFWMDRLRDQAQAVGGTVLSHLGNHEWMNVIGDWRYVYPSEIKTFGTVEARQKMLSSGRIGRSWAANYSTTSRLPLHPSLGAPNTPYPPAHHLLHVQVQKDGDLDESSMFTRPYFDPTEPLSHSAVSFVHGGLSPTYQQLTPFPSRINEIGASLLKKLQNRVQPPPHPPNRYPGLPPSSTPEEIELYESNGPLWYRGWAMEDETAVCSQVDQVLARTGTKRMVMGHTPDFKNIVSRCDGKIIIIDTGISHAYGGVLSALSIHYTFTPIGDAENPEEQEWREREVISALYPDRQDVLVDEQRHVVGNFDRYH
ncbi:Metallo-dependent phosphatase [Pluteus cervinus]|uniref:Metallo-dependent phosphatase n=1 Tax=Pluteus cervinus TaxID=181527 RepID=A0ACD3BB71_9AGAR|nr:Metallo-dependent phosphatase [Pluteus cervinus]